MEVLRQSLRSYGQFLVFSFAGVFLSVCVGHVDHSASVVCCLMADGRCWLVHCWPSLVDQAPGCGSGGERRLVPRIAAQRHLVILDSLLYVMLWIHIRTLPVFVVVFCLFSPASLLALTSCQLRHTHRWRRQEVVKTLNQQRRLIFSTLHSFDGISCTPSRSNHLATSCKLSWSDFFRIIIC